MHKGASKGGRVEIYRTSIYTESHRTCSLVSLHYSYFSCNVDRIDCLLCGTFFRLTKLKLAVSGNKCALRECEL